MVPATAAISSAKTAEHHIPSAPSSTGRKSTAPSSNTNVRKKEISADICPLFKAVFINIIKRPHFQLFYGITHFPVLLSKAAF